MHPRLTALVVVGILLAGSSATAAAQAPRTVEQAPTPAGTLRARTQIQVQPPRMPNLVGQSVQAARQDSRVVGLKLQLVARQQQTKDYKAGTIIGHEPAPNAPVKPGTSVTVFVAVEPPPDSGRGRGGPTGEVPRMPDLVGQPFPVAQQDRQVIDLKLRLIPREQITKDRRPGTIVEQELKPGSPVKLGTQVTVLVAVPVQQPPPVSRMPDLVGQPFPVAQQDRQVIELKLRLIPREQITNDRRPGTIVDQELKPGSPVKLGTQVTVLVAVPVQQPPPVSRMPDLVGQPFESAQQDRQVIELKLRLIPREQITNDRRPGTIVEQELKPGSPVKLGTQVTVLVAVPVAPPPPPRLFPMPDLVGRSVALAERDALVTQLQLQLNQQIDSRAGGLPNTIVRQSVPAGSGVPVGQAVTVFVASGVAVPRVIQQQADAAAERISAVGLNARRTQEVSDETPGTVLRQVPEPGVLVARGAAVGITVAVPRRVLIPNVVGRARADAIQELARLRLRASPTDDPASALPPEQVVAQTPIAGTEVVVGAAVQIAVATGVEVPNLSGLSADAAQRAVADRGLSFEDADQETDAVPPGQVFQQQPASGTRVTRGARVVATVAVAVPVLVPNVVGLPRQRATALVEAAGLRAGPELDVTAGTRLVERQEPAANTRVARLTTITLFVAAPPAPPPGSNRPTGPGAPTQPPVVPPSVPAPVPGPVLTQPPAVQTSPPPAVPTVQPGGTQPPAQNGGASPGSVAIPVEPLLPPWLLSLLVAVVAIAVSTYKLWWPASSPPPPPIHTAAQGPPPAAVDVRPEAGDATLRLEVMGRSLISMEVRVRVGRGDAEPSLNLDGPTLVLEERRLYE